MRGITRFSLGFRPTAKTTLVRIRVMTTSSRVSAVCASGCVPGELPVPKGDQGHSLRAARESHLQYPLIAPLPRVDSTRPQPPRAARLAAEIDDGYAAAVQRQKA